MSKSVTVTVRLDLTWFNVPEKFNNQSREDFKKSMKNMIGADNIKIIDWNIWDNEDY